MNGIFYTARFVTDGKVERLPDPAHREWHIRSLERLLGSVFSHFPCHIDSAEGPSGYFEKFHIPIPDEAYSPAKLCERVMRAKPWIRGKSQDIYRYRLDNPRVMEGALPWIVAFSEPIAAWCLGRSEGGAGKTDATEEHHSEEEGISCLLSTLCSGAIYYWDSPLLEVLTTTKIDVEPLIQTGWRMQKRLFLSGRNTPRSFQRLGIPICKCMDL